MWSLTTAVLFLSLNSDVISIEKTGEHFRLVYDTKGRFAVHRITAEEAKVRSCSSVLCWPGQVFQGSVCPLACPELLALNAESASPLGGPGGAFWVGAWSLCGGKTC